jgi:hypothetical protein
MLAESKQDTRSLTKREMNIVNEVVSKLEPAYDATMIIQENNALASLVAPTVAMQHTKWTAVSDKSTNCQSLARGLLISLERRFCDLLNNVGHQINDASNEDRTPFTDLVYPVAALNPEFRLDWLSPSAKPQVTGLI